MAPTRRTFLRTIGATLGTGGLAGCVGPDQEPTRSTIRVGSKPFPEQEILGYLAYQLFQAAATIQAVDLIGTGDSDENWQDTRSGRQDLYVEYTGTIWLEFPERRTERIVDPARLYERAARKARSQGIRLGAPAPFSNEFVLAVSREFAERSGVGTISELIGYLEANSHEVGLALGEDFRTRPDGWPGLTDFYGLDPDVQSALEVVVTSIGLTYELLDRDRFAVASGFRTDPQLDRDTVVRLEDDREFFVPYQPAPAARAEVADAHPRLFDRLAPVFAGLDERTMRQLNREVLFGQRRPNAVAREYLDMEGVL